MPNAFAVNAHELMDAGKENGNQGTASAGMPCPDFL
jgi:hypothetical protein